MKLKCIAIDDEPLALKKMTGLIAKIPFLELVGTFEDGIKALGFLGLTPGIGLVFLDIQMPEISGLHLAKIIDNKQQVIFTTAYTEYALDGYSLNVTDYLLKPISFERFLQASQKAYDKFLAMPATTATSPPQQQNQAQQSGFVFLKTESRLQKVMLQDILYVEGMKDYLMVHTDKEKIMTLQNFQSLSEKLPPEDFARIHKSFMVALGRIDYIERNRIAIGKVLLPVSDTYKDAFYALLENRNMM